MKSKSGVSSRARPRQGSTPDKNGVGRRFRPRGNGSSTQGLVNGRVMRKPRALRYGIWFPEPRDFISSTTESNRPSAQPARPMANYLSSAGKIQIAASPYGKRHLGTRQ